MCHRPCLALQTPCSPHATADEGTAHTPVLHPGHGKLKETGNQLPPETGRVVQGSWVCFQEQEWSSTGRAQAALHPVPPRWKRVRETHSEGANCSLPYANINEAPERELVRTRAFGLGGAGRKSSGKLQSSLPVLLLT